MLALLLTTILIISYFDFEMARFDRVRMHGTADAAITLQRAVMRWQTEAVDATTAPPIDMMEDYPDGWTTVPTVAEVEKLLEYLPDGAFANEAVTLVSTTHPYQFTGYKHGGGDTFAVEFDASGYEVHLRLIDPDGWSADFVAGVQTKLPVIQHLSPNELTLSVRHPSQQPTMAGLMRRFTPGASESHGLVSPLAFQPPIDTTVEYVDTYEEAREPCGQLGAVTISTSGIPLACIEHRVTGGLSERSWEPMLANDGLICRDTRLAPTHPFFNENAPNMEVVQLASWDDNVPVAGTRDVRVPSIQIVGIATPVCPDGYVLDGSDPRFCVVGAGN